MSTLKRIRVQRIGVIATAIVLLGFSIEAMWPLAAETHQPEHAVMTAEPVAASVPTTPHSLRVMAVRSEARRAGISVEMALAVSMTENWGGDSLAVSRVGAIGVMQVMPNVWGKSFLSECGDAPLTNLRRNACVGVRVLAYYKHRYGNWDLALRAYNGSLRYKVSGDRYVAEVMSRLTLAE